MLYVIKSVGKKNSNKPLSLNNLIEIIKIGYTDDNSIDKRMSSYSTHNKSYDILLKIPRGTYEDEHNLHQFFKKLEYDREWFIVDENNTIENFFKENKTLKEIRSKIPRTKRRGRESGFLREIYKRLSLIYPVTSVENFKSQAKIVDSLYKEITESQIYELEEFYKWLENKNIEFDKESIESQLIVPEDCKEDVLKFFANYEVLPTLYDKLRYLCEFQFSSEESKINILSSITEKHFKEYYEALGPEGCKSLSYNITRINRKLNIRSFNRAELFLGLQRTFEIGKRYSNKEIKSLLKDLYTISNYEATPKASDLQDYFEIKPVKVDEGNKKVHGLEILGYKTEKKD